MHAPTVKELLAHPVVTGALEQAWMDSKPDDPKARHEEGGWIYLETTSGAFATRRAPAGGQAVLDLCEPPEVVGFVVVATFHTHPNPSVEGWNPGASAADTDSAWLLGVPCLIRAEDGIHVTGPNSRRGGSAGGPGFPP